jgi:type 1 glutamine amidotransferase
MNSFRKNGPYICVAALVFLTIPAAHAQHTPDAPDPRSRAEVESVLAKAPQVSSDNLRDLNIVLVASEKDHGLYEHDYPLWQKRWHLLLGGAQSGSEATQVNMFGPANDVDPEALEAGAAKVKVTTAWPWPSKEQLQEADLIVAFSVVDWSEETNADLKEFLSRGGGFVSIHMSCVVEDGTGLDDEVANLIGLSWNWDYTRWRHGPMNLDIAKPDHPICLGLPKQLFFLDEAYWPLYGKRSKVTTIATSKETDGNFALRDEDGGLVFDNMDAIQQKWPEEPTKDEPMFWTYEYGKGRVYGCILGHYDWTFDDPYFRILLLRGMAWAAGESPYRFDPLVLRGAAVE